MTVAASRPSDKYPLEEDGRIKLSWDAYLQRLETPVPKQYTVANLPTSAVLGQQAWASNGRKPGEGAGSGTGVPVTWDASGVWFSLYSGAAVTS